MIFFEIVVPEKVEIGFRNYNKTNDSTYLNAKN